MKTLPSNTAAQSPAASVCLESFAQLKLRGIPYSRVHLSRLIDESRFPKPIRLSEGGRIAWLSSDLDAWLNSRIAARDEVKA